MKLRRIAVQNLRRFTAPVQIEGLADGLNVLSAPNEQGKSTLFDALHAAFFLPHRSQAKEAKALRPRVGGAPEVTVEIECAEGRFEIAKRWFSRPMAEVRRLPAGGGAPRDFLSLQAQRTETSGGPRPHAGNSHPVGRLRAPPLQCLPYIYGFLGPRVPRNHRFSHIFTDFDMFSHISTNFPHI